MERQGQQLRRLDIRCPPDSEKSTWRLLGALSNPSPYLESFALRVARPRFRVALFKSIPLPSIPFNLKRPYLNCGHEQDPTLSLQCKVCDDLRDVMVEIFCDKITGKGGGRSLGQRSCSGSGAGTRTSSDSLARNDTTRLVLVQHRIEASDQPSHSSN